MKQKIANLMEQYKKEDDTKNGDKCKEKDIAKAKEIVKISEECLRQKRILPGIR